MGGYGTYKFATQFPDLFARAQPTVGPPGLGIATTPDNPTGGRVDQHVPDARVAAPHPDPDVGRRRPTSSCPYPGTQLHARGFDDLDYRYEFWAFAPADHFALAIYDQYQPAADFLGDARVDRDPAHVTYVRNPTDGLPGRRDQVANHAYWLSGIEVANAAGDAPFGTIDVRSEGFGIGDPEAERDAERRRHADRRQRRRAGIGYQRQRKEWGAAPRRGQAQPAGDRRARTSRR